MHGFAGSIDAALGREICVDGSGRFAPANAAVGQVESGTAQIEEAEICAHAIGHYDDRLIATLAAEESGIEVSAAIAARRRGREYIVVTRDKRELHARKGLGGGIGAREHNKPIRTLERGKRNVGG